ncbi:MAG TPA: hypothetical protein VHB21_17250 [Minicystis sp.]|nr:hypothetical protein [Minicystis sp.]
MSFARPLLVGWIALAAGCGARSGFELSGGAGGASSAASTSSATSSSAAGGSGGASTSSSSSTGAGGAAPVCGFEPHDTVVVTLDRFDGSHAGCGAPGSQPEGQTTTTFEAAIASDDGEGHIELDECSPAADCQSMISKLHVAAKGIGDADLPIGAFVMITHLLHFDGLQGCRETVQLRNLPKWDGALNPVASGDVVWLAASSADEALAGAGYAVARVPLGCFPNDPMDCGLHDDDVYRVTVGAKSTDVPRGQALELGAPTWIFSNLQSYTTGFCDDPPHTAYLLYMPKLD